MVLNKTLFNTKRGIFISNARPEDRLRSRKYPYLGSACALQGSNPSAAGCATATTTTTSSKVSTGSRPSVTPAATAIDYIGRMQELERENEVLRMERARLEASYRNAANSVENRRFDERTTYHVPRTTYHVSRITYHVPPASLSLSLSPLPRRQSSTALSHRLRIIVLPFRFIPFAHWQVLSRCRYWR
jgi:hypothetical protein